MKILFIAFLVRDFRSILYTPATILTNGFIRAGHTVFFYDYKAERRSSSIFRSTRYKKANTKLIEIIRHEKPDLAFFGDTTDITSETMAEARKLVPYMAQFSVDGLFKNDSVAEIKRRAQFTDATFITTGGPILKSFDTTGNRTYFIPNPCDRGLMTGRAFARPDWKYDLFFAGSPEVGKAEEKRSKIFAQIKEAIPDIRLGCFGIDGMPHISGADYFEKLAKSYIGLNMTRKALHRTATPEELYLYSSDRIAQYMGQGLLTFIATGFELEKMFLPDKEAVYFDGPEDLTERLRFYLKNRDAGRKIAEAGWKKTHERYNEQAVAEFIVKSTMEPLNGSSEEFWM